jgi:hypothetical protein
MSHKGSWSRVKDQQAYHDNLAEILANSRKRKEQEKAKNKSKKATK